MKKLYLPHKDTGYFPQLFIDYMEGRDRIKPYYKYPPSLNSFKKTIKDKGQEPVNRDVLQEVIAEQYQKGGIEELPSGIELLNDEKTFTVCTGHQLCLFGGPLFFIYKIITTINLARALKKKHSGLNFIPIYWMATEDHDFEEINHVRLFDKKLVWERDSSGPVGRLDPSGIAPLIKELKEIAGSGKNADQLVDLLQKSYLGHDNLADATRYFVHVLFEKYGLLIIDADDRRLKTALVEVMEDDVLNHSAFHLINKVNRDIEKHYKPQVNPRKINLFYINKHIRGRILTPEETGINAVYGVEGSEKKFSRAELLKEIKSFPRHFSPNVVLRPLHQELILPNLAYVGGPGEISYWLQLMPVFEHYEVNFPVIWPRNAALLINGNHQKRLKNLHIPPKKLFQPVDQLLSSFVKKESDVTLSFEEEKKRLQELFSAITKKAESIDKSLKSSAEAELQKQLNSLSNLEQKMIRAKKKNMETEVNRIVNLKSRLFPGDGLQERNESFIPWYLNYGEEFIPMLLEQLQAEPLQFAILSEE